jgi:hypothetical protein
VAVGNLVDVVVGATGKNYVQGDFELSVIDFAAQVGRADAGAEIDLARVLAQVVLAGVEQVPDSFGRVVVQSEVDDVGEHGGWAETAGKL